MSIKAGDRIRLTQYVMGCWAIGTEDFTVEEFRHCLGIFQSDECRQAEIFTPLCELYERGPDSEDKYMPNFGEYVTNKVPSFMNIPKTSSEEDGACG